MKFKKGDIVKDTKYPGDIGIVQKWERDVKRYSVKWIKGDYIGKVLFSPTKRLELDDMSINEKILKEALGIK